VKIFVTGGAGYIGGTVASLFIENGHKVVIFDNLSHSRRTLLPAGVDLIEGELADRRAIEEIFTSAWNQDQPFDAVLHFAALIEAGESMVRPEIYFRNNTASTLALLEATLACGPKRLVFSSTAAVYGEPETIPIQEDARLAPSNPYGQSKLLVEQMLAWFNRVHGLRYASLRYFNVAGAHEGPAGITRGEAPRSASSATTTPPPMAPAFATIFTLPTWPKRTCWHFLHSTPRPRIGARSSTTLVTVKASAW
jgi:UDP-glucose 4-epimerase